MLLDFDILDTFGTNDAKIAELFTSKPGDYCHDNRIKWEKRFEARIDEGTRFSMANYQFYAAADLAWDSSTITKELVPLQLYAQGKISFAEIKPMLKDLSPDTRSKFVKKDESGEEVGIDIPAFHKVVVNLVRSFVTRRTAALATKYVNLFPFMKYEPVSTSFVAKLRADVLSERMEMVTNAYGYRHDLVQVVREMLLYSHTFEFVSGAWDKERQIRKLSRSAAFDTSDSKNFETEAFITREGLIYDRPHPSRVFWDKAYPVATINTDTGCTYIGHWKVVRSGSVTKNLRYFNRDKIAYTPSFAKLIAGNKLYRDLYFASDPINFPNSNGGSDVAGFNDREKSMGVYTTEKDDESVLLTEYFERVIPKDVGLGDYPYPVWVRLVVAGERTVIYGEILPSTPAVYYAYNCHDGRLLNNSFTHDAIPWMDQASNMFTNLLHAQKAALIKIIALDVTMVSDPKIIAQIRSIVEGESIYTKPLYMEYRGDAYAEMQMNPKTAVTVSETSSVQDVTMYFRSIMQIMSLAERVLGMSSNESAQSEPREITATESANISNTVNVALSYMGLGIDEGIDAKKKQLFESFMAKGQTKIVVPIAGRYTPETIAAAGFTAAQDDEPTNLKDPKRTTILGSKEALNFDYNFTSRDGSERPSNTKAAEVLVNLLAQMMQIPGFAQKLGQERLFEFLNHVVMLSGAGVDLRFEMNEQDDGQIPNEGDMSNHKDEIQGAIQQILKAIQDDRQKIDQLQQLFAQFSGAAAGASANPNQIPQMPTGPLPQTPATTPLPMAAPGGMPPPVVNGSQPMH